MSVAFWTFEMASVALTGTGKMVAAGTVDVEVSDVTFEAVCEFGLIVTVPFESSKTDSILCNIFCSHSNIFSNSSMTRDLNLNGRNTTRNNSEMGIPPFRI